MFYSKDRISCVLFRLSLNSFLPGRILSTFCRSKVIQSVLGPRVMFYWATNSSSSPGIKRFCDSLKLMAIGSSTYLQEQRKRHSSLIMKLGVFVNDSMLVQFATSFGVILGGNLEIGWSTPGVYQARMAAWSQAGGVKPFDNVSLKLLIRLRREEHWTRKFGVLYGSVNKDISHYLKQNKWWHDYRVHHLRVDFDKIFRTNFALT